MKLAFLIDMSNKQRAQHLADWMEFIGYDVVNARWSYGNPLWAEFSRCWNDAYPSSSDKGWNMWCQAEDVLIERRAFKARQERARLGVE